MRLPVQIMTGAKDSFLGRQEAVEKKMKRMTFMLVMLLTVNLLSFGQLNKSIIASNNPGVHSMWPQVAFGPDGILHIVWVELTTATENNVMYATWDGTTLSQPRIISGAGEHLCYFPFIAVNTKGMIAVIWAQGNEHWLAVHDPVQKAWLLPEMVATENYGAGFLSRPKVGLDEDGNIFTYFFNQIDYCSYTRAKINGAWEPIFQLNSSSVFSKEGGICVAPDGRAWVIYAIKTGNGDYKAFYRRRTKDTTWTSGKIVNETGNSQGKPYVGVGLNNIPYISYMDSKEVEGYNSIWVFKLDENTNPATNVAPSNALHYPRVAVDSNGFQHVAIQYGPGDNGEGVRYFDNTLGTFLGYGNLPDSDGGVKLPGIAAEGYGNVAISFESRANSESGFKQAYFVTREPVVVKHFDPPIGTKATINITGLMSTRPVIKFSLSWAKNPDNSETYVRGYRIYKKLGSGDWELVSEVGKDILSFDLTFNTPLTQKIQFSVATVSVAGFEGDRATFY
jgi:hypothetical protein